MPRKTTNTSVPVAALPAIESQIRIVRGHKILIDSDLAALYQVPTKVLVQAVKRNRDRFPEDFMFQLTDEEFVRLRSQIVTSKLEGRGGRRTPPYAFTEQGVAMLSSVLRSPRAITVNIEIMRAFVRLRAIVASNKAIAHKLQELERKLVTHDHAIADLIEAIQKILDPPTPKRRGIGFVIDDD